MARKPKTAEKPKSRKPKAKKPAEHTAVAPEEKNLGGRPSIYTEAMALEVCNHIASGISLRSIEQMPGMPSRASVLKWVLEDRQGFASIYARARELQLECEADEIVDIADDGSNDFTQRAQSNGDTIEVFNREAVERSKLRVSTRQWRLARLMQGKYGDKIEQTHKADAAFLDLWQTMGKKGDKTDV